MNWTTIVIIVCLLLAVYLVWMEYGRPNRLRLPLRLIAVLLAVAALACIALPLTYSSKIISGVKEGVLLTPGFDADSLSAYQNSKLFTTETAIQKANPKLKITLVTDLADFAAGNLNIAQLHVLGYGLNGDELKQLNHFPITFHTLNTPAGITAINWNRHIKVGDCLQIQGKFSATAKTIIILKGLNTTLDSLVIPAGQSQDFEVKTTPKNTGRATYTLLALNGKDTLERETIPFEVQPSKPIKILMLATSPDFENKFLKDWLSQHGYSLAIRTSISKDKFSREYFNMAQTLVDRITPALLEKFDLLLGDLSAFKSLSGSESGAIQQQMQQNGLGVIVKADSTAKGSSFLANAFPMDRLSDKDQKTASLSIEGQTAPSAKLTLDATFIKYQSNTQPLVNDEQNHIIASSTIYGSGKIVFTTLGNTYSWVLSGNQADYTSLWSMLIDKAIRKTPENTSWTTQPALPVVNTPVSLMVEGPTALPVQIKTENNLLAFKQNETLPFRWTATYWPDTYGWQQVTQNGITLNWWYAFEPYAWTGIRAAENITATKRYVMQKSAKNNTAKTEENYISKPVSKLWFYALLLLCCTALWVERKL